MCVCGQSVCSAETAMRRRHHTLLGQRPSRHVFSNWLPKEKEVSAQSRCVKGTEEDFPFDPRKPIFSDMHGLRFLSLVSLEIAIFVFVLFRFNSIFIFYVYFFLISHLILTPNLPINQIGLLQRPA